jgi:hypothetical protein
VDTPFHSHHLARQFDQKSLYNSDRDLAGASSRQHLAHPHVLACPASPKRILKKCILQSFSHTTPFSLRGHVRILPAATDAALAYPRFTSSTRASLSQRRNIVERAARPARTSPWRARPCPPPPSACPFPTRTPRTKCPVETAAMLVVAASTAIPMKTTRRRRQRRGRPYLISRR